MKILNNNITTENDNCFVRRTLVESDKIDAEYNWMLVTTEGVKPRDVISFARKVIVNKEGIISPYYMNCGNVCISQYANVSIDDTVLNDLHAESLEEFYKSKKIRFIDSKKLCPKEPEIGTVIYNSVIPENERVICEITRNKYGHRIHKSVCVNDETNITTDTDISFDIMGMYAGFTIRARNMPASQSFRHTFRASPRLMNPLVRSLDF